MAGSNFDEIALSLARRSLSDPDPAASQLPTGASREEVLACARYHGILPLIAAAVAEKPQVGVDWLIEAARAAMRSQVAIDLARRPMIIEAIEALHSAGTEPIVLKGEALAHTHYAAPWQRPRADTDLLVAEDAASVASQALVALGYQAMLQLPGSWATSQTGFVREGPGGMKHVIDLHWRINNSAVLAGLLTHAEIAASATPLAPLGADARAPNAVHALLLACLHRVGSEDAPYVVDGTAWFGGDRLIWLADIDRLVRSLDTVDRASFTRIADERGAGRLCAAGIRSAAAMYSTPSADELATDLCDTAVGSAADRYLTASARRRDWLNFRALPSAHARLAYLRQTLWPDAAYLRARYPQSADAPVLKLRLTRIFRGLASRLR